MGAGPMTLIVVVTAAVVFVAGLWLFRCASRSSESDGALLCASCKNRNRIGARFCARCGKPLDSASLDDTV